ncbi:MAG: RagB/SusD family nutrient uptake outer membrane protein [candidate division KSB1 bacterium]|nr:RagB/SusD family nutrient uptake outer membrane protein [candidate division KSB1 bacterium]MDZ7364801.1 RagB/SusD family nutrient uptake outer membrane protein [candidate division KSB1 bacterium]MDZ7402904.1 RagB/SusD family nutrient uptake outer membrane protein [candidate division KSB1 bacterium]
MKNRKLRLLVPLLLLMPMAFWVCTNLDETPFSAVTPENFYRTEEELVAAVIPVYANLLNYSWGDYMFLQEVASDEIFIPQRGGDWGDGGIWRELQEHKWTPTHGFVNGAWLAAYTGIARANSVLENLEKSPSQSPLKPVFTAEVRVLRAFYYWWLMDLYGGVPVVTAAVIDPKNPPKPNTRQEVFDFIVREINAALPNLQTSFGPGNHGRVTRGAAQTLLATVYLNAEVYTGSPKWTECIAACDAVINSGMYRLLSNYSDFFKLANEGPNNAESIWVVGHKPQDGVGFLRFMATLHYNQLPQNPWNGFSVLADFYNKFDTSDVRFKHMLVGPQFVLSGPNAGQPAFDRQGNRLIFTVNSPIVGATEGNGVRILKWQVDPNQSGGNAGNDFAIFRYSHVLLTKAEALNELNGPNQQSIDLINQVRARSFEPDKPIALANFNTKVALRDRILDERGFEFLWENFRRQDQIRTNHWLEPWTLKAASDGAHRKLYPIPQAQLDANPNLRQNPGY